MTFLHILPNFNPLRTLEVILFFTFISENLRPPLLDLVPRLGCELEKMTYHFLKNTSQVEIIITISIENRIKSNKNFGHVLREIFYTYCYYNFNP